MLRVVGYRKGRLIRKILRFARNARAGPRTLRKTGEECGTPVWLQRGRKAGVVRRVRGDFDGEKKRVLHPPNTAEQTGVGILTGGAAAWAGPTVQGGWNFNPRTSPATWGPKAQQLYVTTLIGGTLTALYCMILRKC